MHPDLAADPTIDPSSQASPEKPPTTPLVYGTESLRPKSPIRVANTSARRCVRPTLLQSPARLGHSACIRRIFDSEQQQSLDLTWTQRVLNPTLANVPRHVSTMTHGPVCKPTRHEREESEEQSSSLHKNGTLTNSPANIHLIPQTLDCSSDSWSDDSGYLNVESCSSADRADSPTARICDWLLTTCTNDPGSKASWDQYHATDHEVRMLECCAIDMHDNSRESMLYDGSHPQSQRYISETCKRLRFDHLPA